MRRRKIWIAAIVMAFGGGGLAIALTPDDPQVVELLSGISFAPSKSNIDLVMGNAALEDLIVIAQDETDGSDIGLRIRAFRALGVFEDSNNKGLAVSALTESVALYKNRKSGEGVLFLRASILSLAQLSKENSVDTIIGLLSHPSRDIRAASAQALGITGSVNAVQPLRNQALVEEQTQVKLAIADALFSLEE